MAACGWPRERVRPVRSRPGRPAGRGRCRAEPLPGYPTAEAPSTDFARLYPYPTLLSFSGKGDPNDAGNWTMGEATVAFTTPDWAGAGFFAPYEPMERQ